jgi:type I restriction enzyme R subunit
MTPKPKGGYGEGELIEQPAIDLFKELRWETVNAQEETYGLKGTLGRDNRGEAVLTARLLTALKKLNPDLPPDTFTQAVEQLTRDRSRMSLVAANREVYTLIRDGVKVRFRDPEDGGETSETLRIIDWDDPGKNDFLLVSQFWITGEMYTNRADLVGFVNGIPLLFIELKAAHKNLQTAFTGNLKHYKDTVPHLFWFNGFIVLSNGSESKAGSITGEWGHFADWKKINSEGEKGVISLETIIKGTCEPSRFLDLMENFILFMEAKGGIVKLVAKNHQYLGVGNALAALEDIKHREGRLGVFWHTQGSGKSVSMILFAQKVLRKIPGNWTFLIITDRQELDDQIYKTFTSAGAVTEAKAQADSAAHLRQLLKENHRYVFTLIQKFRNQEGRPHPKLSDRSDIIVITDEAHRSQYDTFALNMRNAIPNASFLAFTGTPLIAGQEQRTKEVFGDYISVYNFKQSVDDGATVPLFYENRIPELQLTNDNLNEEMEALLEAAELDEAQEKKLEREFSREYHLITRDERLEKVAEDLVEHFTERGQRGKGMVVSIDKATAVKMYDRVRKHWQLKVDRLKKRLAKADGAEKEDLIDKISYMEKTDMAVVVSASQNEIEELKKKGVDIVPHRKRLVKEDLDTKFKDPDDPFRLVFVCAMWMTGFDVPSCSTIYLDKPMRNHTLMQTIARANRVFKDKVNGLIVDYVGVFRNLQKALAIYGAGPVGGGKVDMPVKSKAELLAMLNKAVAETVTFCAGLGIDAEAIIKAKTFQRVRLLDDAVDAVVANDDTKRRFSSMAGLVGRIYKAILPDPAANEFLPVCSLFRAMQLKIESLQPGADITMIMAQIEELLDASIGAKGYLIQEPPSPPYTHETRVDLSKIDFKRLQAQFLKTQKRIEVEKLRGKIKEVLDDMVGKNKTRADYLDKFQQMIDEYNSGAVNVEEFFKRLMDFAGELKDEEARAYRENLSEEELAIFDLITKPDMKLTKKDEQRVKKVAHDLLATLKREKLVLDWKKTQQGRGAVRVAVEEKLEELPEVFTTPIYRQKCDVIYQHVYESYYGGGGSAYAPV